MKMTEKTKIRSYRRSARHMISICLALVMLLGSAFAYDTAVAFQTERNPVLGWNQFGELGFIEEWDLSDFQLDNATNFEEFTSYEEIVFYDEAISENRRNYIKLLEGGYNNHQLRQRFVELFGDGFRGEYIFNNYRTIFDLHYDENIDSAFLRVLSGYRVDFRFQNNNDSNHQNARGLASSEDGRVRIFPDSDIMGISGFMETENDAQNFNDLFLQRIMDDMLTAEFIYDYEAFYIQDVTKYEVVALAGNSVFMSIDRITSTSIAVDLRFENNTLINNNLQIWDPATGWRWIIPNRARSGIHNITGLSPGATYYIVAASAIASDQWVRAEIFATTPLPPPDLISFSRSSIDFRLDRTFTDALGPALTNDFLDATNQAFYVTRTLVGGPQFHQYERFQRMQLNHVRDLPSNIEGWAGWPIQWQLTNVHGGWGAFAIDHAQRMRATSSETTEIPIHEIGHNFDNWIWSFEPEAIAILFTYYYYATTGRRMAIAGQSRTFRGDIPSLYEKLCKSYNGSYKSSRRNA